MRLSLRRFWNSLIGRRSNVQTIRRRNPIRLFFEQLEGRWVPTVVAYPDFATTAAGVPYHGASVLDNDVTSFPDWTLTADLNSGPTMGTLTLYENGTYDYMAPEGFSGTDEFSYFARHFNEFDVATVTITVYVENDPPVGVDDSYQATQGQSLIVDAASGVLANDSDPDGDSLSVAFYTFTGHGSLTVNGDGSFSYLPDAGFTGIDGFSYHLSDGDIEVSGIDVTIEVVQGSGGGNPPVGSPDSYNATSGQTLSVSASSGLLANDSDPDGDPLSVASSTSPANGSVTVNGDGSFTYSPNSGFTGTDQFTYHVSDGLLIAGPITVTINVDQGSGGNNPPVGASDSYSTPQDQALTVSAANGLLINDSDPDGDPLFVSSYSSPANGSVSVGTDGSFVYVPNAGVAGMDLFTYSISDGQASAGPISVTITVGNGPGGNNPPMATNDSYSVVHDHQLVVSAPGVLANDTDIDGDALTVVSFGSLTYGGTLYVGSDGAVTYTPPPGFVGIDSFTYTISDGTANATGSVTLTVTNQPVVANDDSYSILHDQTLTGNVLTNDTDQDGDPLTAAIVTGPAHTAAFALNADGSFTYTPAQHWTGIDQFTYQANDGSNADNAVASIAVENHAPTVTLDEPMGCCLGDPTVLSGFFEDPDDPVYDGPYTVTVTWGDGNNEVYTFAAPSAFQYQHTYVAAGLYTITVQVQDVAGAMAQAQVQAAAVVVDLVWWEFGFWSYPEMNPGNGTPGTNIGQRIFPDKNNPGDTVDRRIITIGGRVSPAVAGRTIFFAAVDVDDPSANTTPVDRETDAAGTEIADNRGAGVFVNGVFSATTDANGEARVSFRVSMQPGDNWRAAASCRQVEIGDDLRGKQNDAPQLRVMKWNGDYLPTATAKVSDVLTVWRRLHVEVDSMGAVAGNTITGQITNVQVNTPVAGRSRVTTDQTLNDSVNRFENGTLTDSLGVTFNVRSNGTGANFTLEVDDFVNGAQPALGQFFLVDDDLLKNGDDVPMPDTSTLEAALAEAYVKVQFDVGDGNNNVAFVLNVNDPAGAVNPGQFADIISSNWTSKNLNENSFWVAYLLGAFQESQAADNDPDSEPTVHGRTDFSGGSLIYIESNRDQALQSGASVSVWEADTVVHEVGHAMANSADHPVTGGDATPVGTYSKYEPPYLAMIRSAAKPWGP